jgi:hypothetical protein
VNPILDVERPAPAAPVYVVLPHVSFYFYDEATKATRIHFHGLSVDLPGDHIESLDAALTDWYAGAAVQP